MSSATISKMLGRVGSAAVRGTASRNRTATRRTVENIGELAGKNPIVTGWSRESIPLAAELGAGVGPTTGDRHATRENVK